MPNEVSTNITLDPWQNDVLNHEGNLLLLTGRQVGKTTILARKAAERMIEQPGCRIIGVSLTEDQAFLMKIMVQDYLERNYPTWLKVKKALRPTKNKINLSNGSTYNVRPVGNTGDAIRGFTGDVLIVDEAAFMPEMMWSASTPTLLTTGGEIWMCSTPHVKDGWFYEQYEACKAEKSDRFRIFEVTSEWVIYNRPISEHWTEDKQKERRKFLEDEKNTKSEVRYAQEYLGKFMDDLTRVFSDEWIDKVCILKEREPAQQDKDYYLGVDIARMGGDETTFEVIRKLRETDKLKHVYHSAHKKKLTTWTEDRILELNKVYNFRKIYLDAGAGSLGVGIFDQLLKNPQTARKVEAINNRKIVLDREGKSTQRLLKEDLYDNLLALGIRGDIELLDNDQVRASLRSVTKEIVKSKYSQSKVAIKGTYDHIAEGLIRAAYAIKEKSINAEIYYI